MSITIPSIVTSANLVHPLGTSPRFGAPLEVNISRPYVPRPLHGIEAGSSSPSLRCALFLSRVKEDLEIPSLLYSYSLGDEDAIEHHSLMFDQSPASAPTTRFDWLGTPSRGKVMWDKDKLQSVRTALSREQMNQLAALHGPFSGEHWLWRLLVPRRIPCIVRLPAADHIQFLLPLVGDPL